MSAAINTPWSSYESASGDRTLAHISNCLRCREVPEKPEDCTTLKKLDNRKCPVERKAIGYFAGDQQR